MHRYSSSDLFKSFRKGFIPLSILFFMSTLMGAKTGPVSFKYKTLASPAKPAINQLKLNEQFGRLPLAFEVNEGQFDPQVKFLCRGRGYQLFITPAEAVLTLKNSPPRHQDSKVDSKWDQHSSNVHGRQLLTPHSSLLTRDSGLTPNSSPGPEPVEGFQTRASDVVRLRLGGGNRLCRMEGLEKLPGISNYFIGNDPSKWRTNIPQYAKAKLKDVYPGIDMVYYGSQGKLEYDFVVKPGADPKVICMKVDGVDKVEVDRQGDLLLSVGDQRLAFKAPIIYQEEKGLRKPIEGRYVKSVGKEIAFKIMAYDATRNLVIDPTLVYSTFAGGSVVDRGHSIVADASGNAYVTGYTDSPNFPITPGAFDSTLGFFDVFVTKVNATGTALIYSTFIGGGNIDEGFGIALDNTNNAYITGFTDSTNYPTTAGAYQTALKGNRDVLVTKLNPAGNTLVYSTYLGGNNGDEGYGIALDGAGNAYVTGIPQNGFPTTPGAFLTVWPSAGCGFVTKMNSTGTGLVYSTYVAGTGWCNALAIAVDGSGNAYVTGYAQNGFIVTPGAFQTVFGGGAHDAYVFKLNSAGSAPVYSTYLGGSKGDDGYGIAVDSSGNAYVTGYVYSGNFPTTPGAFQTIMNGIGGDAYITKLNALGSGLVFSTFLGGSGTEDGFGIALDASENIYVSGWTTSTDYPVVSGATQPAYGGGGTDVFFTEMNSTGTGLVYSTYLGGSDHDTGAGIALDGIGGVYVTGETTSADFPTTSGAFQTIIGDTGGASDVLVAKWDMAVSLMVTSTQSPTPSNTTTPTRTFTLTPTGTYSPTLTTTYTATVTSTFTSTVTATCTPTITITGTSTITPTPTISPTPTITASPMCEIRVWPDPYKPSEAVGGTFKVGCLPEGAKVRFFTLTGEHVNDAGEIQQNVAPWDGRNKNGVPVSTGIYYYVVEKDGQVIKKGKFLVASSP
jgi:hypothetical protein